jgi:hypothetical protein
MGDTTKAPEVMPSDGPENPDLQTEQPKPSPVPEPESDEPKPGQEPRQEQGGMRS